MPARALLLFDRGLFAEALAAVVAEACPSLEVVVEAVAGPDAHPTSLVLVDADRAGVVPETILRDLGRRFPEARYVVLGQSEGRHTAEEWLAQGVACFIPKHFGRAAMLAVFRLTLREGAASDPEEQLAGDVMSTARDDAGLLESLGLTPREIEVLSQAALGKTNLDIARALGIAEGTVRVQMTSVLSKLNVRNRSEAILVALRSERVIEQQLKQATSGLLQLDWLMPHMNHRRADAGEVLFRKGDPGTELFYIQRGTIRLPEIGVDMGERAVFGEIGVFHPEHRRTSTAVCLSDVDLFVLSDQKVRQMYFLNPGFAFYLLNLLTTRLVADRERNTTPSA